MITDVREAHAERIIELITQNVIDTGFSSLSEAKASFLRHCANEGAKYTNPEIKFFSIFINESVSRYLSDNIYLYTDDQHLNTFYKQEYEKL